MLTVEVNGKKFVLPPGPVEITLTLDVGVEGKYTKMAMKYCGGCLESVSHANTRCPRCGSPL